MTCDFCGRNGALSCSGYYNEAKEYIEFAEAKKLCGLCHHGPPKKWTAPASRKTLRSIRPAVRGVRLG